MTSPLPPRLPESEATATAALSPSKKIFLASSIFLLGLAAAVVQFRGPNDLPENRLMDPLLVSAPLPSSAVDDRPNSINRSNQANSLDSGAKTTTAAAMQAARIASPNDAIPSLADSPPIEVAQEKYAQAYPQPILIVDETLLGDSKSVKSDESEKQESQSPKPFVSVNSEFKPIHQFSRLTPNELKEIPEKGSQPKPMPVELEHDELLPLFDFAENLGPISGENHRKTTAMPENPFSIPLMEPETEIGVRTVVDPNAHLILKPLRPLVPTNETEPKASQPQETLLQPLKPLTGAYGVIVTISVRR